MFTSDVTLLLVEDNDLDVIVLQRLMKRLAIRHTLVRARNGEEALDILRSPDEETRLSPPFIMLVDINMPRMTGFELLSNLADDEIMNQVHVYLMSTSDSSCDVEKAFQYAITDYLVKPLNAVMMQEILKNTVDGEQIAGP